MVYKLMTAEDAVALVLVCLRMELPMQQAPGRDRVFDPTFAISYYLNDGYTEPRKQFYHVLRARLRAFGHEVRIRNK